MKQGVSELCRHLGKSVPGRGTRKCIVSVQECPGLMVERLEQNEGWGSGPRGDYRRGGRPGHGKACRSWPGRIQIYPEGAEKGDGEISRMLLLWFGQVASGAQGYHPTLPGRPAVLCHPQDKPPLSSETRPGVEGVGIS